MYNWHTTVHWRELSGWASKATVEFTPLDLSVYPSRVLKPQYLQAQPVYPDARAPTVAASSRKSTIMWCVAILGSVISLVVSEQPGEGVMAESLTMCKQIFSHVNISHPILESALVEGNQLAGGS